MLIAALFTIDKKWKQPKCPLVGEGIKCSAYIQRNIVHIKRKEILTYVITWKKLEDTVLSEISQWQNDKYG